MRPAEKASNRIGTYATTSIGGEPVWAYVPPPLPPAPPLELGSLYEKLEEANRSLGRLDGATSILPDPPLFLYMYVRKEALLSAQIEGTQSSLSDLMLFETGEAPGVALDDVREVSNYVAAMDLGIKRLREGMPLSNRLIRELHAVLLRDGRGQTKAPGEFRRSQNWRGGTRPGNAGRSGTVTLIAGPRPHASQLWSLSPIFWSVCADACLSESLRSHCDSDLSGHDALSGTA